MAHSKGFLRKLFHSGLLFSLLLSSLSPAHARIIFVNEVFQNDSETYQIGTDDDAAGTSLSLEFGGVNSESISWDTSDFTISDDLIVGGNLSAHGNTFTLDSDNTGVGADVDIVAEQGTDSNGTIRYDSTNNYWSLSNNGGAFSQIATAGDLAAVQARESAAFALSVGSFADVTLDSTDVETDSTILEHDNTNTDRITVSSDGLYMITYEVDVTATGTTNYPDVDGRVRVNDATVINGSVARAGIIDFSGVIIHDNHLSKSMLVDLNNGDYITLQLQTDGAANASADTTLSIVKLDGTAANNGAISGTNNATFTIDEDNTAGGANVELVANQGTDPDASIRYNATTDNWQVSVDGGTNYYDLGLAHVFSGYDSAGGTNITTTAATMNIDATSHNDTGYTLAADQVTINQDGLYKVTAWLTASSDDQTGAQRSQAQLYFQDDTGGAFANVTGAFCMDYMREQNSTTNVAASCSFTTVQNYTAGDIVRLQHQMSGTTTGLTAAEGSGLTIELLRLN